MTLIPIFKSPKDQVTCKGINSGGCALLSPSLSCYCNGVLCAWLQTCQRCAGDVLWHRELGRDSSGGGVGHPIVVDRSLNRAPQQGDGVVCGGCDRQIQRDVQT